MWSVLVGSASGAAAVVGSASSSATLGGNYVNDNKWQYALRYDKNASDFRHGNVFDDEDLEGGVFALPDDSIAWVGIYYSRFFESEFMGVANKRINGNSNEIGSDSDPTIKSNEDVSSSLVWLSSLYTLCTGGAGNNGNMDCGPLKDFFSASQGSELGADAVLLLESAKFGYNTLRDLSLFSHHYVIVETTNGYFYSFDKYCDYIDIRRDSNKTAITHVQAGGRGGGDENTRKNVRFADKMGWLRPHDEDLKLSDLLPFLRFHMHEPYHLFWSNCQKFAKELWEVIVLPSHKRGKQRLLDF